MAANEDLDEQFSRLEVPISFNSLMTNGGAEFAVKSEDILEKEEDTVMERAYSPEKLEPFSNFYIEGPYKNEEESENTDADEENADAVNEEMLDFPTFRKRMTNVRDDGKLMKMIERSGSGGLIPDDDTIWVVYVHYAGYMDYADYTFDATRLRQKKPVRLRLDELFPGFVLAVKTMRKGELSKFLIHPDLAFGSKGVPPRIPANQTLLYEIELFDFVPHDENLDTDDTKQPESYLDKIDKARKCRERGNKRKKLGKDVNGAISQYRKGIYILVEAHRANEEEELEIRRELVKLYANLAVSFLDKKDYRRVCTAYNNAIHDCVAIAADHVKLNYASAKALRFLGDYGEAKNRIRRANRLKPGDTDILNEMTQLDESIKKYKAEETKAAQRMFGFTSDTSNSKEEEESIEAIMNEVDEEFKTLFEEFLNDFINDDERKVQKFQEACSLAERTYCKRICRKKNISVREIGRVGEKHLIFTKFSI